MNPLCRDVLTNFTNHISLCRVSKLGHVGSCWIARGFVGPWLKRGLFPKAGPVEEILTKLGKNWVTQNTWFIVGKHVKMDDLGDLFQETSI